LTVIGFSDSFTSEFKLHQKKIIKILNRYPPPVKDELESPGAFDGGAKLELDETFAESSSFLAFFRLCSFEFMGFGLFALDEDG
jgi:hypothetical protein